MYKLTWDVPRVTARIGKAVDARLRKAADHVADRMRRNLGTPFPPASRPGAFPHYRSKRLLRGVMVVKTAKGYRVVVRAVHAGFLERGTRRMRPRPFFRATIRNEAPRVRRILRGK